MGAALALEKPVILLDVYNDGVRSMKGLREKILKQRAISIEKMREAENVAIIIEIKPGQRFGSPKFLLQKLKEAGKNAVVITMSCPRIAVDDFYKYEKPILTMKEALVALGLKTWEETLKTGFI